MLIPQNFIAYKAFLLFAFFDTHPPSPKICYLNRLVL